jgi:TonB family protein
LQTVLHEHTGLGYFVDLLLKSLFVLLLMVLGSVFTRRLAASLRHLIWCIGFTCLFVLPLFIGLLPKIQVPITAPETIIIEHTVARGIATFADTATLTLSAWWQAFLSVYFTLLGVQLLYIALGLCKVISLSRSAVQVSNPRIHAELENLILDEGITVPVTLKKSTQVYSPVSWGLFAPEIILPEHADDWCVEKTRNVLIHELSHIQRLDWLTTMIVRITCALYWYNPLIWYAARKLDEEAEQACDDAVILTGRCHSQYASNLLEIASHARIGILGNAVVQAIAGSFLGSRVFSILDTSKRRQNTEVVWVVRGLLIGCTAIAILASLRFVPLVNVTSIDPRASTAFSVIFIPKSESAAYGNYVENLYNNEQQAQNGSTLRQESERRKREIRDVEAGTNGGVMASSHSEQTDAGDTRDQGPSLLEEYLSATGIRENDQGFEQFVNDYTSDIRRHVQSGIDLSSFDSDESNDTPAQAEARLIAIKTSSPEYPSAARRRGLEGYSIVEYAIDSNGLVQDPVIVDSSPGSIFNRSSLHAIQNYRFEPPTLNGKVVNLKGRQTKFVYQLKPG